MQRCDLGDFNPLVVTTPALLVAVLLPSLAVKRSHSLGFVIELFAKAIGVAEVGKVLIIRMRSKHPPRVFYRAPKDFGSCGNFTCECDHAVGVGAISAVDCLNEVEVSKVMAIKNQVIAPSSFWYLVNRKAYSLEYAHENIK